MTSAVHIHPPAPALTTRQVLRLATSTWTPQLAAEALSTIDAIRMDQVWVSSDDTAFLEQVANPGRTRPPAKTLDVLASRVARTCWPPDNDNANANAQRLLDQALGQSNKPQPAMTLKAGAASTNLPLA